MRKCIHAVAMLVLLFSAVATARADGLGARGFELIAGFGISLVIGGLAIAAAVIVGGFLLIRGRRYHSPPVRAWRVIGILALLGVLVMVCGPILTVWLFGR